MIIQIYIIDLFCKNNFVKFREKLIFASNTWREKTKSDLKSILNENNYKTSSVGR